MIVGEAWGANEREKGLPFVGASGHELTQMLTEAGIDPKRCFYTNLINHKPNGNDFTTLLCPHERGAKGIIGDGVVPSALLLEGLRRLDQQILAIQPKLIIACGNWALWWLTHRANAKTDKGYKVVTGIDSWRGSQLFLKASPFRALDGIPVLPIYHPAATLRNYPWRKIVVHDLGRAARYLKGEITWYDKFAGDRWNIIMPKAQDLVNIINGWIKQPEIPVVLDLETKQYRIHIVGLSRNGQTNISIPFFHITAQGFKPCYTPLEWLKIYTALYTLFTTPGMQFVGQNLAYDMQFIAKFFHCTPRVYWDTMVCQHVMLPAQRKGLDFLSSLYCEHHVYWKDDLKESTDTFDTEMACLYNCEDLYRTHEIWQVQEKVLDAFHKRPQFMRRMRLFPILVGMMIRGVAVDDMRRRKFRTDLLNTAQQIANWLEDVLPDNCRPQTKSDKPWFASPQQLAWILYKKLKLREMYDPKTKSVTTGKEALVELGEYYPHYAGLFSAILLLRSIKVIAGNILSAPLEIDGRMRTAYNLAGPITYRLASAENVWGGGGNLQNVPRDRDDMSLLEADLI